MRPVLFVVPQLPWNAFLAVLVVAALVGGFFSLKTRNSMPLAFAAGVAFLAFISSRTAFPLHSYGLLLVVGFFASTTLACLEAKRRGYDPNIVLDAAMPLLLVSIIACRILYFIIYPHHWEGFGEFLKIWNGGLSFHGAIIGGLGTLSYFAWSRKIPLGTLTDFVAPGAFLGMGIGRIGCFLNGCCYGHPTDVAWACVFPNENNRHVFTPPSHPAQLYSTLMSLVLFAILWSVRKNPSLNRFSGQFTLLFLGLFAVERFVMEIFRNGATAPLAFGLEWLTKAQLASVLGLIVVVVLWVANSRRANTPSSLANSQSHVSAG